MFSRSSFLHSATPEFSRNGSEYHLSLSSTSPDLSPVRPVIGRSPVSCLCREARQRNAIRSSNILPAIVKSPSPQRQKADQRKSLYSRKRWNSQDNFASSGVVDKNDGHCLSRAEEVTSMHPFLSDD